MIEDFDASPAESGLASSCSATMTSMCSEGGEAKEPKKEGRAEGQHGMCDLCRELRGTVRIQDAEGKEVRICLRCDRLIDWR